MVAFSSTRRWLASLVATTVALGINIVGCNPDPTVVWHEDFDVLDPAVWAVEHSTYGDGNDELQCYRPGNVRAEGGHLVLTARFEVATCPNGSTRAVTSGMVRSRGVRFSPGQAVEFRVKLNPADPTDQAGLWPAVWASGWAGPWPLGGEMDWLEVMTAQNAKRSVFSIHYAEPTGARGLQNKAVVSERYFSDDWHTVRFEYRVGGHLVWFLDGTQVFEVTDADTAQGYPAPFDQAIDEIKINLALGGRPGPLSDGALGSTGATFLVDYIRILEL
jgi:beta-glucanase (GH16 family)